MIKREDFNGKRYEEMVPVMQADLADYVETVNNFVSVDECTAEEQILMASMQEVEDRLKDVKYTLPENVVYENKKYSRKDIAAAVIYFLNKLEVKWENTLGLYQLVKMWKGEDFKEIPYHVYDSTLRCLNQVTFKGFSEWEDIQAVYEYLSECRNEYSLDTGMLVYLSECHNTLMNRMKELDSESGVPDDLKTE